MSLSARLLHSVANGDFGGSSAVLSEMMRSLTQVQLSSAANSVLSELGKWRLMLRDHVASALEMQPLYFSLRATCPEILTMAQTGGELTDARTALVSAIRSQLGTGPSILDVSRVDTETIGSGEFSVLLPYILDERAAQMKSARVYTNGIELLDRQSRQYAIHELWDAAYGRMVLTALEIPAGKQVVTYDEWSRIDSALSEAGFEPEGLMAEQTESEWLQKLASLRAVRRRDMWVESEMPLLDSLFWARDEMGYSDHAIAIAALETAQICGSLATIKHVQARAQRGPTGVRQKAIEVLATMRAPGSEAFLEELLHDREDPLRPKIAQALSELMSRPFAESAGIRVRVAALTAKELPGPSRAVSSSKEFRASIRTLLNHRSRLVRDEGLRVLSSLNVEERAHYIDQLMTDTSETIRMAATSLIGSLPEDEAKRLLERAARDDSVRIRKAAIRLAEDIGLG